MPVVWSSPCAVSFTSQLNVAAATQHGLPLQRSYSSRAGNVAFQKLRIKATAELAEPRRRIACAERLHEKASSSRPLLNAKSEEGLFQILRKEVEAKNLSSSVIAALEELYRNYYNAVAESGISNAKEIAVSNMATAFDRMLIQFEDPFTFSSYHRAIREPFDYYLFGQNYIRPLIDFRNSYVGNLAVFNKIESQLRQGENIVLTSNHQTEADPAVISLLLEKTHPFIAENIIYVAGDRVIHDPVCKPFSMGRNLLCVYSKKHINDDPELAEKKNKANTRTLKEMTLLLRKGGQIIWIAPSGGRDRPNPDTKDWLPDPFDDTAVDNMRRLMEYSGVPGHMHPLSLLCYEVMPPPLKVEKEIGEKRRIGYHGVGISVAPEMKFSNFSTACDDSNKAKKDFSKSLYEMVLLHYKVLQEAIYSGKGMSASNSLVSLSQPWEFPSSISIQNEL